MHDEFLNGPWTEPGEGTSYRGRVGSHPMPMQLRFDRVGDELCQTLGIVRGGVQLKVSLAALELGRWVTFFGYGERWYSALRIPYELQRTDRFRVMAKPEDDRLMYVVEVNEEPLGAGSAELEADWLLWLRTTWWGRAWLRGWQR